MSARLSRDEERALRLMKTGVLRRKVAVGDWTGPGGERVGHCEVMTLRLRRLAAVTRCGRVAKLTYAGLLAIEGANGKVRVKIERGNEGLYYATSPDMPGLLAAAPTRADLMAEIPAAIAGLCEANGREAPDWTVA
jgi:predicted RNase H-like HicB family nuclease